MLEDAFASVRGALLGLVVGDDLEEDDGSEPSPGPGPGPEPPPYRNQTFDF